MSKEEIMDRLSDAVVGCKLDLAKAAAQEALDTGVSPIDAINVGLVKGMNIVGERYAAHTVYLPQVLVSARCMYAALDILLPAVPKDQLKDAKRCAAAVVEGDVHDIGKNIVKTMLTAGGCIVSDFGKDVNPEKLVKMAEEAGVDCICLSTLMTPTMDSMKKTLDVLRETGYRSKCTVTIGGPPTSPEFASEIGADHRDLNAQDCIGWLKGAVWHA
ncbi:MAG: B12-binding domain-containing protein [Candidatus Methanoplasma sp.]|jgi:methanogenic corrinoid protein MtbC1|nr:B12-binding domain-containing protein [Candidatus Methanoplasma sp.]